MKTIILGTAPTFFTGVRQKTNNHCFVACVASALLDEGYDKLQDLIVDGLPSGLGKDTPDKSGVLKAARGLVKFGRLCQTRINAGTRCQKVFNEFQGHGKVDIHRDDSTRLALRKAL